ncbi:MAG: FAD-dependent oxidoreductase [Myxococcota bacterium]|nr:FAD-dependent oxidoreductase [Myxococcota bacterium]
MERDVVIAGGGLAGLSCAKVLVERGHRVRIYEGLPYLGGRAATFRDADGDWVEQGLHVFLGAYSEFRRLMVDVGIDPDRALAWMTELRLEDSSTGVEATYANDPLRAPLATLLRGLGQNDFLSLKDKLSMVPLLAPGMLGYERLRRTFDQMTVTEWWRRANGSELVLERFIRPFCRAIQFTEPEEFSAFNFLVWVHQLFRHPTELRVAGYRGARDETIFQPLGRWLGERGAIIRCDATVARIETEGDRRVRALVLESGERIEGDLFVSATPVWALRRLLPDELRRIEFFSALDRLPIAPAISVQLFFDRIVVPDACYTLVGHSAACAYQDQHTTAYPREGSRLSVIVSPADEWMERSDDDVVAHVIDRIGQSHIAIQDAPIVKRIVLRHREHLVRPIPGAMSQRPTQKTPLGNFFLAGDWTEQRFMSCQEGAVRSGLICADAILASAARETAVPAKVRDRAHP